MVRNVEISDALRQSPGIGRLASVTSVEDALDRPLGAVLAGGAATRMGGTKATVDLAGRPLIAYPLAALAEAGLEGIVIAKPGTDLPTVGVSVIQEPAEPSHPLLGVTTALQRSGDRSVVVLPCDAPFVTRATVDLLVRAGAPAVTSAGERLHPLIAHYPPDALPGLSSAIERGDSATSAIEALAPVVLELSEREAFNVNTPDDLAYAASIVTRAL